MVTICPICGEIFTPNRKTQKYCSRECGYAGRMAIKEHGAEKRVESFIESLPDLHIVDVLNGSYKMDNRMSVPGAGTWKDKKFIVLVVDD